MEGENAPSLLEDLVPMARRRKLLPVWIRVFCILFMISGVVGVFCIVVSVIGIPAELSVYGFEGDSAFSPGGAVAVGVYLLNGTTAWALWFEKDYAIDLAKVGALVQMGLCMLAMVVLPYVLSDFHATIRLELAVLIPYFIKLTKIEGRWKEGVIGKQKF